MKKLAMATALFLAACTAETVPQPSPAAPPSPQQKKVTQATHPHVAASRAEKHKPPPPPPPDAIDGLLSRELASAYMDREEQDLRNGLRGSGLRIARIGDSIEITIPLSMLFDERLQGISWDGSGILSALATVIDEYDRTAVQIGCYSDTTGSKQTNLHLSDSRAKIVSDVLTRDGVAPNRISAHGYGETHLLVPTGDNVNQPRNRRVEIRIVPKIEA